MYTFKFIIKQPWWSSDWLTILGKSWNCSGTQLCKNFAKPHCHVDVLGDAKFLGVNPEEKSDKFLTWGQRWLLRLLRMTCDSSLIKDAVKVVWAVCHRTNLIRAAPANLNCTSPAALSSHYSLLKVGNHCMGNSRIFHNSFPGFMPRRGHSNFVSFGFNTLRKATDTDS